jgi:hypothetical protein
MRFRGNTAIFAADWLLHVDARLEASKAANLTGVDSRNLLVAR